MRFISVISALLSAAIVLAKNLYPYAGYQLGRGEALFFQSAIATFDVPEIHCGSGDIAYLGAALGDPLECYGGGGIEGGVVLSCAGARSVYYAYWRLYPGGADHWSNFNIAQGNKIRVRVDATIRNGEVTVTIENLTTGDKIDPYGLGTVELQCLTRAAWMMRANVDGTELQSIPSFTEDIVLYDLGAWDHSGNTYGTNSAQQMTMRDSAGEVVANAFKGNDDPDHSIRIVS